MSTLSISVSNGSVSEEPTTHSTVTSVSSSDLVPNTGGILATARNNAGIPTSKLTPDTTVEVDGTRTSLKTAALLGYVRQTASGDFIEINPNDSPQVTPEVQPKEAPKGEPEEGAPEYFHGQNEAIAAQAIEGVPSSVSDSLIASVIGGTSLEDLNFGNAASHGLDPEDMKQRVEVVLDMFTTQAQQAAAKAGIHPEDWDNFVAYAHAKHPEAIQNAMRQHAYGRTTQHYKPIFDAYVKTTVPQMEHLKEDGIEVVKEKSKNVGDEIIRINGMEVTRKVAAKLGWI